MHLRPRIVNVEVSSARKRICSHTTHGMVSTDAPLSQWKSVSERERKRERDGTFPTTHTGKKKYKTKKMLFYLSR